MVVVDDGRAASPSGVAAVFSWSGARNWCPDASASALVRAAHLGPTRRLRSGSGPAVRGPSLLLAHAPATPRTEEHACSSPPSTRFDSRVRCASGEEQRLLLPFTGRTRRSSTLLTSVPFGSSSQGCCLAGARSSLKRQIAARKCRRYRREHVWYRDRLFEATHVKRCTRQIISGGSVPRLRALQQRFIAGTPSSA